LDPNNYGEQGLLEARGRLQHIDKDNAGRPAALADLDAKITRALLAAGRDVAIGRKNPARLDRRWQARRELRDLAGSLDAAGGQLDGWFDAIAPKHPQYLALQNA